MLIHCNNVQVNDNWLFAFTGLKSITYERTVDNQDVSVNNVQPTSLNSFPTRSMFLLDFIDSLTDKNQVLEALYLRFQEEGRGEEYRQIIGALNWLEVLTKNVSTPFAQGLSFMNSAMTASIGQALSAMMADPSQGLDMAKGSSLYEKVFQGFKALVEGMSDQLVRPAHFTDDQLRRMFDRQIPMMHWAYQMANESGRMRFSEEETASRLLQSSAINIIRYQNRMVDAELYQHVFGQTYRLPYFQDKPEQWVNFSPDLWEILVAGEEGLVQIWINAGRSNSWDIIKDDIQRRVEQCLRGFELEKDIPEKVLLGDLQDFFRNDIVEQRNLPELYKIIDLRMLIAEKMRSIDERRFRNLSSVIRALDVSPITLIGYYDRLKRVGFDLNNQWHRKMLRNALGNNFDEFYHVEPGFETESLQEILRKSIDLTIQQVAERIRMETGHSPVAEKISGPGGIDFTQARMNIQTQNTGEGIKFHLDPAQLAQLQNAEGFVPVIISMQPMVNVRKFLGIESP